MSLNLRNDQHFYVVLTSNRVSISLTFYVQLLSSQIPKALKNSDNLTVFFELSGSA